MRDHDAKEVIRELDAGWFCSIGFEVSVCCVKLVNSVNSGLIGAKCALIWISICFCAKGESSKVSSHLSLLNLSTVPSELILFAANLTICLLCIFYFSSIFYDKRKLACKFRRLEIFIPFVEETDARKFNRKIKIVRDFQNATCLQCGWNVCYG